MLWLGLNSRTRYINCSSYVSVAGGLAGQSADEYKEVLYNISKDPALHLEEFLRRNQYYFCTSSPSSWRIEIRDQHQSYRPWRMLHHLYHSWAYLVAAHQHTNSLTCVPHYRKRLYWQRLLQLQPHLTIHSYNLQLSMHSVLLQHYRVDAATLSYTQRSQSQV